MVENEQQTANTTRSKRRRKLETIARILDLLLTSALVLVFIKVVLVAYLSWIGIAVGAFFVGLMVASSVLGLAGKKRLKRGLNWLWGGAVILVAVTVLAVLLWPEGNSTWKPYSFDEKLAALEAKRAVPDQDNAAFRYESVFAAIDVNDRPRSFLRKDGAVRDELSGSPWKGVDYPEVSRWLDSQSEQIDQLLRIGKMEKCRWPVQADTYDEYTVPYKPLRHSVQLLVTAANRDLGEGRLERALAKYFCLLGIADHLYQQTQILDFHVGSSYERTAMQMIRRALVQGDLSVRDIDLVGKHLPPAADTWLQHWPGVLEFEKLRYMNLLARFYEVNEKSDVRLIAAFAPLLEDEQVEEHAARIDRLWQIYHLMHMPSDPQALQDMANRHFARFDRLLEPGYPPQAKAEEELFAISPNSMIKAICNTYRWAVEMMFFGECEYVELHHLHATQMAQRRGTWLVLALCKYRDMHGQWPETLDLISEYVPPEAFLDPTNGDKFVYRRDGDNFNLYGRGPNKIDEGGRFLSEGGDDWLIWPRKIPQTNEQNSEVNPSNHEQIE